MSNRNGIGSLTRNALLATWAITLAACSASRFGSDSSQTLNTSVFGQASVKDAGSGVITQPSTGGGGGSIQQPVGSSNAGGGKSGGGSIQQPGGNSSGSGGIQQPGGSSGGGSVWGNIIQQIADGTFPGGGGSISQPGGGSGGGGGGVTQPGGSSNGGGGSVSQPASGSPTIIPVQFVCSTNESTMYVGTNVRAAKSLELKVTDDSGAVVCDLKSGVQDVVSKTRALDISACGLTGTSYSINLFDPAKPSQNLLYAVVSDAAFLQEKSVKITRADASKAWTVISSPNRPRYAFQSITPQQLAVVAAASRLGVLYASNPRNDPTVKPSDCNSTASPLMIDMTPVGQPDLGLQLSRPDQGVFFDILGRNARPVAHTKVKISSVGNPNYMFLALPKRGRVNGIDQLFGDNTFGPDGQFAANGFAALEKYDLNGDGRIDARDPVFASLVLWSDRNSDGIAQPSELAPLSEFGITAIHLNFDPTFYEEDDYGNRSMFRAIVEMASGPQRMIFDLWFALGG